MRPQISEGFGSEWILLHPQINSSDLHGKEGIAIILFPETDLPSFLALKKLYEVLPPSNFSQKICGIIQRIEREHQDIVEAGTWEK